MVVNKISRFNVLNNLEQNIKMQFLSILETPINLIKID